MAAHIKVFIKSALLCLISFSVGLTRADDTDVFFGTAASTGDTRPNVMFVLDTSGSMGAYDGYPESRMDRMKDAVRQMLQSDLDMNIGLMGYSGAFGGGPVLYPITTLNKEVCAGFDCEGPVATADNVYLVDGSLGDVEQNLYGGGTQSSSNAMDIGNTTGGTARAVGLRYADINIARGSTILGAQLEFTSIGDQEDPASFTISIEDVANSEPYQTSSYEVTSRTYHSTTAPWEPDEWYDANVYPSSDITELVQNIIGRDDWCTNGALAFKIEGTGTRRAWQFEKSVTDGLNYIPRLRIIQDPSTATAEDDCSAGVSQTVQSQISATTFGWFWDESTDDVEFSMGSWYVDDDSHDLDLDWSSGYSGTDLIGLRFGGLEIPQGSTIQDAHIQLTYEDYRSGDMDIEIAAESSVNTLTYGAWDGPISGSRNYLPSVVAWDNVPALSKGDTTNTPDLTPLVQALVSSSSWNQNNNAISFTLTPTAGSGRREFESFEGSPSKAAKLFVTFSSAGSGSGSGSTATPAFPSSPTTPVYSTKQARDELLEVVDGLTASGATPTVDAFYEAALYMRGEGVDYGIQRGTPNNPRRNLFRVSHESSYTGGILQRDPLCTEANLNLTACRSEQITGSPTYVPPITGSCQANHIVLLSDGETNNNSSTSKILSMIGESACTESGDIACATDLATWLHETDHNSILGDIQNVTTHTIAFNLDGAGKTFLENVAAAGGGTSYEADSAEELLGVFSNLVSSVIDIDTGFTAAATTVNQFNRLNHRDDLYFALFKPNDSAQWNGNIKRFRMGDDGSGEVLIRDFNGSPAIDPITGLFSDTSQSWWREKTDAGLNVSAADSNVVARGGAANQLALDGIAGIGERRVFTWLSDAGTPIDTPIDLTSDQHKLHENNELITDAILDIIGEKSDATEQQAYKESLIQWARGVDVLDNDNDGSTTDIRRSMGDPMHSRPVIVNYPTGTSNDVRSLIFVGTNEGYLHAIDASNGQEQFAFIPYELLENLKTFYVDEPGYKRPYGLDGPVSLWRDDSNDNQIVDNGESAYLFVGMRRGGSSYYALDISNPNSPKLAWTIKGGAGGTDGFEDMGQSWSRMTPVKMYIDGQAEDVLVFGGGYDDNQDLKSAFFSLHTRDSQGNGIYIVKATTGELLWSGLGTTGGSDLFSDMDYGFNSNIRTIDIDRDGYVDQMYAADAGGQLWRFDITAYHASASDALIDGSVIADFSSLLPSDHRRFYNEPDVALIEGGGERFLTISIGSGWRANPLDEITEDRFYVVKQYDVFEKPDPYPYVEESDLIDVTNDAAPETNEYGWFLKLDGTGEKVLSTSVTFDNKVIFSTYIPTAHTAVCSAEIGSGRAYILDAASGAPAVDLNNPIAPPGGSGTTMPILDLADRSIALNRSGIPPDAMIIITDDGPKLLVGGEQLSTGIENHTRRTFWSDEGESSSIKLSDGDI